MRFTRRGKYEPTITPRKIAAHVIKLRHECEKLPLFSGEIAAAQLLGPKVEEVMEQRMRQARQWESDWRQREYLWWRRGRAILTQLPAALQSQIRTEWQIAKTPGTSTYLLSHIRSCSKAAGINIDLLVPLEFASEIVDRIGKAA
jgi:hypothetical protein